MYIKYMCLIQLLWLINHLVYSIPHSLPISIQKSHQIVTHIDEYITELHGRQLLSTTTSTTLHGCPSVVYSIDVTIGNVQYKLNIDTGSTTLGVAADDCKLQDGVTSCGIYPTYSPNQSNTSQYYGYASRVHALYGDMNGWYGQIYSDSVAVGNTSAVGNMKFAVIEQQIGTFFQFLDCNTATYNASIDNNQGIIGFALADQSLSSTATDTSSGIQTDSWFHLYYQQQNQIDSTFQNMFVLQMCQKTGNLWLGGLPPTLYQQGTLTSSDYVGYDASTGFYTINMFDLSAITPDGTLTTYSGLHSICCPSRTKTCSGCTGIVDSGSTSFNIPLTPYNTLTKYLLTAMNNTGAFNLVHANGVTYEQSSFSTFFAAGSTTCIVTQNSTYDTAWLNQHLPSLKLTLAGVNLSMLPVSSYLQEWDIIDELTGNQQIYYCNGLSTTGNDISSGGMKLGWAVINQFTVIFDKQNKQIGFVPTDNCLSDTTHVLVETSYTWHTSAWSTCYTDTLTNNDIQLRHVECMGNLGERHDSSYCNSSIQPTSQQSCVIPSYGDVCAYFQPVTITNNIVTASNGSAIVASSVYNENGGCINGCLDTQTNTCHCYTPFTLDSNNLCTACLAGYVGSNCTLPGSKSWIASNWLWLVTGIGGGILLLVLLLLIRKQYRKYKHNQRRKLRGNNPVKQLGRGEYKPDTVVQMDLNQYVQQPNSSTSSSGSSSQNKNGLLEHNADVIPIITMMTPQNAHNIRHGNAASTKQHKPSKSSKITKSPQPDIYASVATIDHNTASTTVPVNQLAGPQIGDWQEFYTPQGYPYYYNVKTKRSEWSPPAEFMNL